MICTLCVEQCRRRWWASSSYGLHRAGGREFVGLHPVAVPSSLSACVTVCTSRYLYIESGVHQKQMWQHESFHRRVLVRYLGAFIYRIHSEAGCREEGLAYWDLFTSSCWSSPAGATRSSNEQPRQKQPQGSPSSSPPARP
jgi:hypothetical protein